MPDAEVESYVKVIQNLKDIIMEDVAVCVTDTEKYLCYRPGDTIDLKNYPGKELSAEDPLYLAIREGKPSCVVVTKDLFGFPFKGVSYPIKNAAGNVIGAVGIARSLDKQSKVEEAAGKMFESLQHTNQNTNAIASNSEKISASMTKIVESTQAAEQKINESDKILKLIKDLALQTDILALNAAIEATRAGQSGKGFSIVSDEMRKLSEKSRESADKISNLLVDMKKTINQIIKEIETTSEIAYSQTSATGEITTALTEITSNSKRMIELSKIT